MFPEALCRIVLAELPAHARLLTHYLRGRGILARQIGDADLCAAAARATGRNDTLLEVVGPHLDARLFLARLTDLLPGLPLTWVGVGSTTSALILVRTDEPASSALPFLDYLEVAQLLRSCANPSTGAGTQGRRRRRWPAVPQGNASRRRRTPTHSRRIAPREWP